MIAERLAAARAEIVQKSKEQIDAETAAVWGARAVAAFEHYKASGDIGWFAQAVEYRHEALEHAASGPPGTLRQIHTEIEMLMSK